MSQLRLWAICAIGCLTALGCEKVELAKKIGPSNAPVLASLNAMGGADAWADPSSISATAVLTVYDDKGQTYTNEYQLDIDLAGRTMDVKAPLPRGRLTGRIKLDGRSRLRTGGQDLPADQRERLTRTLEQVLHLAGGPGNFIYSNEQARTAQPARIAGREMIRVNVGGDNSRAVAYYFDALTHLLQHVTTGADRAGGEGSIATYTYRMTGGGRAFPQRIVVTRLGQHVLIGDRMLWEAEFKNVRLD